MIAVLVLALAGLATSVEQVDRPLAGGQKQTETVTLRAGDALRGAVEQRGIDVVVKVTARTAAWPSRWTARTAPTVPSPSP